MKKQTNSFLLTDAKVRLFSSRSKKSWINFPHLLRHAPTSATKPIRHSKSCRKTIKTVWIRRGSIDRN